MIPWHNSLLFSSIMCVEYSRTEALNLIQTSSLDNLKIIQTTLNYSFAGSKSRDKLPI